MRNLVGLEPSTYYYQYQPVQADALAVRTAIQDVAARFPRYGYVRVYAQLKREHCEVVHGEWQVHVRRPEIHHSDQGMQYACTDYTQSLEEARMKISMTKRLCRTLHGHSGRRGGEFIGLRRLP